MDTLTHGLLGATVARLLTKEKSNLVTLAGATAAMAPDLDFFIQSKSNPLLLIEYHRHFTHSLLFIPIGGFFIALIFWLISKRKASFKLLFFVSTVCYATHGFLDTCTSYGTLLFWPFSHLRVSWDFIAILDLFVSIPLLIGLIVSQFTKTKRPVFISLLFILTYLSFGFFQNHRGIDLQKRLASARHQKIEEGRVLPTLTNLFLWRSIYKSDGKIYVDAFWVNPFGKSEAWEGGALPIFNLDSLSQAHPSLKEELQLYDWFSDGYLVKLQENPLQAGDLRYSLKPQGIEPLWGIELHPEDAAQPIRRVRFQANRSEMLKIFWKMLMNDSSSQKTS